jgi:hypothetical protein
MISMPPSLRLRDEAERLRPLMVLVSFFESKDLARVQEKKRAAEIRVKNNKILFIKAFSSWYQARIYSPAGR